MNITFTRRDETAAPALPRHPQGSGEFLRSKKAGSCCK
jgi:hypothetical protein